MRAHRSYIAVVVITVLAVAALSTAVNVVVDPYGLHRLVEIRGFNQLKPAAQTNLRLVKAYNLTSVRPDVIMLGNSRVDEGFDPYPLSVEYDRTIYNAGLPGGTIYELYRYLQHAQAARPLGRVLLALDVLSFNTNYVRTLPSFVEGRLLVQADGRRTRPWNGERLRDLHNIYVSLPGMLKAVTTIADQDKGWTSTRTALGFNPMIEADYYFRSGGYHRNFMRKNGNYIRNLRSRGMNFAPTEVWPEGSFFWLERIVTFCRKHDIQLDMFIHPYHAHVLEIMHATGIWPAFEDWKRGLVALLTADAVRYPDGPAFPLWDFSGYNPITTEAVPAADETNVNMLWYWESSHYKAGVGRLIATRMYDLADAETTADQFGVRLGVDNLERHLTAIHAGRDDYRRTHAREMTELEELLRQRPSK